MESRLVMNADQIARACARMAHQILEANQGANDLVLMGIRPEAFRWPSGWRR
jgi:pyrimidine operon attenuation protein/uracil phosphoribosyltransferase